MSRLARFTLAVALVAGCGSSDNSSSVNVSNMNPLGTVGGLVVDAATEMPLAGATVTLISGGTTVTAMTDATGLYTLAKVPAGTFTMSIAQKGYSSALIDDQLSGAVGNFPVANPMHTVQQVGLVANTGSFAVRLVDDTGSAVAAVKIAASTDVREVIYDDGTPRGTGAYTVSATTGADGTATFSGLPDYAPLAGLVDDTLTVTVPPIQSMGTYSFLGLSVPFHMNALVANANGTVQVINIVGPSSPLTVLDSNITYLKGKLGPNATTAFTAPTGSVLPVAGPITIAFNQAINGSSLRATILDENAVPVAATLMPTVATNLLTLTPSAMLAPATRYNLVLHVVAATASGPAPGATNGELDVTAPFFTQPTSGATVSAIAPAKTVTVGNQVFVQFTLTESIGFGYGTSYGTNIDCAAFYQVPSSAGFNNDATTVFQGDWKTTAVSSPPQNLVCHQPLNVAGGPYLDVTQISSLESTNSGATLMTGFSDRWQILVDTLPAAAMSGPCANGVACTKIGAGSTIHLIFSRQTGVGVKRADGTPVADNIMIPIGS